MSRRYCLVGNSHLAAPKLAWEGVRAEYPAVRAQFYGATRKQLGELEVKNGAFGAHLRPTSKKVSRAVKRVSGGSDKLKPGSFDAVILFSLGFNFHQAEAIYRTHRTLDFNGSATAEHLVSADCFRAALRSLLEDSLAVKLVRQIRQISDVTIMLSLQPYPSEAILKDGWKGWTTLKAEGDVGLLQETYISAAADIAEAERFDVIYQPVDTLNSEGFTKQDFCENARRLDLAAGDVHPVKNYTHMNADYGERVLQQLFAADAP
ncbi:MAG: hypothetical protein COB37_12010 [Kordiimonadales bacterium]|nr:MAG: hypothetical protein COB37_12010 [Kordiimonadales bacterium]